MDDRLTRRGVLAAAGAALSVSVAGCSDDTESFPANAGSPDGAEQRPQVTSNVSELYRGAIDSVASVQINSQRGNGEGTAWTYDDTHLVTNEHVVRNATETFLKYDGDGWREAEVVGVDRNSDLAVMTVEEQPAGATPLPVAEEQPAVGTPVAAIGNPFGRQGSFTTGVVSGRDRTVRIPQRQFSISPTLQTDAAINPGNSGGPLLNYDGNVVGVVSAGQGEGLGFAIPAPIVQKVIPALIADGEYEYPYLGIRLASVTPGIIQANNLDVTFGVYVDSVVDGTPADGVLQGSTSGGVSGTTDDPTGGDVIVRMNDTTIQDQQDLSAFLALETRPGTGIDIEVVRDGQRQTVSLTLGSRPST